MNTLRLQRTCLAFVWMSKWHRDGTLQSIFVLFRRFQLCWNAVISLFLPQPIWGLVFTWNITPIIHENVTIHSFPARLPCENLAIPTFSRKSLHLLIKSEYDNTNSFWVDLRNCLAPAAILLAAVPFRLDSAVRSWRTQKKGGSRWL